MRAKEFLTESLRLKDLCKVGTNFEDADFWLQRKGSETSVGKPSKEFNPENIGVKVTATEKIDPQWLYYVMVHLHNSGYWKNKAAGVTNLVNIRSEDVGNVPFSATNENVLNEYRKGPLRAIRQMAPHYPDYVIKDMLYKKIRNSDDLLTQRRWIEDQAKKIDHWEFERGMFLNLNMLSPHTKDAIKNTRQFGDKNPWGIDKDEERMINAYDIVKQKGMENLPPIILVKTSMGYDLWEGWHRTMAALKLSPGGVKVNAYIGYPTDEYYRNSSNQTTTNSYGRQYTRR